MGTSGESEWQKPLPRINTDDTDLPVIQSETFYQRDTEEESSESREAHHRRHALRETKEIKRDFFAKGIFPLMGLKCCLFQ
jgi:hypothetical protein